MRTQTLRDSLQPPVSSHVRAVLSPESVEALLGPALPAEYELSRCEPFFLRDKGSTGALAAHKLQLRRGGEHFENIVSLRSADATRLTGESRRLDRFSSALTKPLPPWLLDETRGLLLLSFPIDRKLSFLWRLLEVKQVIRWLRAVDGPSQEQRWRIRKRKSAWRLLSYRPERRAVIRWDLSEMDDASGTRRKRGVVLRYQLNPHTASATWIDEARSTGVGLPRVLADPLRGVRIEEALGGAPLSAGRGNWTFDLEGAGRMVGMLHASPAPANFPLRTPEAIRSQAQRCCEGLSRVEPELASQASMLLERLGSQSSLAEGPVVIHGDLHLEQFLFHVGVPKLVDWDRVARGPAAEDLGSFHAHLVLRDPRRSEEARRAFEFGYSSRMPLPDRRTMAWFESLALLRLVEQPLRRGQQDWRETAARLLREAKQRAEGSK